MANRTKPGIFSVVAATIVSGMLLATIALSILILTNIGQVGAMIKFVQHNERSIDPAWTQSLNSQIDKELSNLIARVSADRSTVSRFHNGKVDLQGIHFVYVSSTNEVDRPGVHNELNRFQNIPTSMINNQIHTYIQGECVVRQTSARQIDSITQFYKSVGIRTAVKCPIFDSNKKLVAQAGVDFTEKTLDPSLQDQVIKEVRSSSLRVQDLLNNAR